MSLSSHGIALNRPQLIALSKSDNLLWGSIDWSKDGMKIRNHNLWMPQNRNFSRKTRVAAGTTRVLLMTTLLNTTTIIGCSRCVSPTLFNCNCWKSFSHLWISPNTLWFYTSFFAHPPRLLLLFSFDPSESFAPKHNHNGPWYPEWQWKQICERRKIIIVHPSRTNGKEIILCWLMTLAREMRDESRVQVLAKSCIIFVGRKYDFINRPQIRFWHVDKTH